MIHPEGKSTILYTIAFIFMMLIVSTIFPLVVTLFVILAGFLVLAFLLYFFRRAVRKYSDPTQLKVVSPADGKIVAIEKVFEKEFLKEDRIQVSIFMSPWNVHSNWSPISGKILYAKHFPGKYLMAFHPKSSTENEHFSFTIENEKTTIHCKQIAGILARRIVNYLKLGQKVQVGEEIGFIKFGSRVDLFLPLDSEIKVELNQKVKGCHTEIAILKI